MNKNRNKTMTVPTILRFFGLTCITVFLFACNPTPKVADEDNSHSLQIQIIDTVFASRTDSLEYLVKTAKLPVFKRICITEELSYFLIHNNIDRSIYYAKLGLSLSENKKNDSIISLLNCNLGMAYTLKQVFDTAKIHFDEALHYAIHANDEHYQIYLYNAYGKLYADQGNYLISIEYFEKARQLAEKNESYQYLATISRNIGIKYYDDGNYVQAENYLLKAIEIYDSKFKTPSKDLCSDISRTYCALSKIYDAQKRDRESFETAQKALEYAQSANNKDSKISALIQLSFAYNIYGNDHVKALEMSVKALELAEELNIQYLIADAYHALGSCYRSAGNYSKSKTYYLQALELTAPDDWARRKNLIMGFHTTLAHLQETDEIITALALYDSISDAIHDQKVQNTISDLQIRYETEKKELEIARQQKVIARQNMQRGLLVGGIAVSAVILLLLWYMLNLRTRRNRALTERNDALSEMNATKDKFFSIISHDLKNPAVAQRDALQLLVKNARLWDVDTLADYYLQLLESAEGEVELIFNLLGWAQIQTGRLSCVPGTFDISNVMPNLSLINGICNNKGITLVTQIPKNVLITCDNNMISTVIRNLLTNAIKFTPSGGTVTLLAEQTGSPSQQKNRITITDTGIGMNCEQIDHLFRLDRKQSREGTAGEQGNGLGLIVCKELLGKHGSTLNMESEEGKGSRFWFEV